MGFSTGKREGDDAFQRRRAGSPNLEINFILVLHQRLGDLVADGRESMSCASGEHTGFAEVERGPDGSSLVHDDASVALPANPIRAGA